ncbi:DNA sulfur modification protein DndD [Tuberibacillus sp. Marseille-P3662]|uniref:DNA sulfur modification protein DndD n=1 Tax=Tuberibacillus sp. Marseille-P3662 TaxID=1965358 RepID=UPI000A1CD2A1|nr:DNA sulfur modification protein DndD [Tuberibacillus sp. Marseille-P3662]
MRFVKLALENFRVFSGQQTVYFGKESEADSSIVLVGGLNGTGKTSILTAVQIILYGKGNLTESEFKKSMNGTLNNYHYHNNGNTATLSLTIETNGVFYTISATLYYDSNQNFSMMERSMSGSNKHVRLTESDIQDFVNKNIPYDVSSFFLFDGEKIQEMVDKQEDNTLKKSIQKIIALEFYKKSVKDINEAKMHLEREYNRQVSSEEIQKIAKQKEELEDDIQQIKKKISTLQNKYKAGVEEQERLKKVKQKKIDNYYNTKSSISKKITRFEEKLKQADKKLESYAKESLPILIIMPIIEEVQKRIKQEFEYKMKKQRMTLNFQQFDEFMENMFGEMDKIGLNNKQKDLLYQHGKKVWADLNNIQNYEEPAPVELLHDLNEKDKKTIESVNSNNLNVHGLIEEKQNYEQEIEKLNTELDHAPEAEDYREEDNQIEQITKTMGEYSLWIRSSHSKLNKEKSELERLNHQYNEKRKQLNNNSDLDTQLDLVKKVWDAGNKFVDQVTTFKARCIKEDFEKIIHKLLRKTDDFSKIEFDIQTYSINIYNHNGTLVQLQNRSAGEKQIIALSLIWALTKNAAIDLPYIIDTPLGRLDSIHRKNLVEHFFPQLSDQVIILSTDTEVNEEFNKSMMEHVQSSYRLEYDEGTKCTAIQEGYFKFNKEGRR